MAAANHGAYGFQSDSLHPESDKWLQLILGNCDLIPRLVVLSNGEEAYDIFLGQKKTLLVAS